MSTFTSQDSQAMARAIQLAKKGLYTTHPNPRVGCVITQNGHIIAEGWHQYAGKPHAEINALNQLNLSSNPEQAQGSTAYVTLEPCFHTGKTPPCSQALIKAGVARVVVAMRDPNPLVAGQGLQQLQEAGIQTACGLMEAEARTLNPGFIKRMEHHLPWVSVKLAMSLDGRTAMASGESKWITSEQARRDVQLLRAKASAVLTGQGTVLADDPSLNVRLSSTELEIGIDNTVRQPIRVVLDPELKMSPNALMLGLTGETLIFTTQTDTQKHDAHHNTLRNTLLNTLRKKGAEIITLASASPSTLPLREVLTVLAQREINEIHVEAGATLCGALIQEGLVDELVIYMAPHLMGANARGLLNIPALEQMKDRIDLDIQDIRAIGPDWRIIARPKNVTL